MKTFLHSLLVLAFIFGSISTKAQNSNPTTSPQTHREKIVLVTGVRFAYPLVQKWIDDYNKQNPDVQIVIESRGSADPANYDILVEAHGQDAALAKNREYIYIARYAILPVANSTSDFAKTYSNKGLSKNLIKQLYFNDVFADKEDEQVIKSPYTIYTRLKKAGTPIVFTKYFGYQHQDIKGIAIAGADEHLLKAILRDSTAVSYLPVNLIYDPVSKKPVTGLTVLPVDLNGNGKVSDEEKFYSDISKVIQILDEKPVKDINNVPLEYINISIDKNSENTDALEFLRWVVRNGQNYLHDFGYLKPEPGRFEPDKFEKFLSKQLN